MKESLLILKEIEENITAQKEKLLLMSEQKRFRMEQIDSFLKELKGDEEEDFKVFSPRNPEDVFREQIEKYNHERKLCEEDDKKLQKEVDKWKTMAGQLNTVIASLELAEKNDDDMCNNTDDGGLAGDNRKLLTDEGEKAVDIKNEYLPIRENENTLESVNNMENFRPTHIAHQILNCVSYIVPDFMRAKLELTAIAKELMKNNQI